MYLSKSSSDSFFKHVIVENPVFEKSAIQKQTKHYIMFSYVKSDHHTKGSVICL